MLPLHLGARVAQWVRSLDLTTHTILSPIRRGFVPGFVNYKKGCTRLAAASDKVYQLLAHGLWFSPGTPASSTTKTGRHDIAEILLKVALNTKNQSINLLWQLWIIVVCIPYIENLLIIAEGKYLPHNQYRVTQTLFKFKCQLKPNWHLKLLELYIGLIYT